MASVVNDIGVYTICKNESKFVKTWVESMWCNGNGAKRAFILDTGSNDGTVELFKSTLKELNIPEEWLVIDVKTYDFFRFDVARNDNLDMVKPYEKELGALISVDLDEILLPEFWDDCREIVSNHPKFERIYYMYAWNHDQNGNPKRVFWYDKIHPVSGCRWVNAVHEILEVTDKTRTGCYRMNPDILYLHHYADPNKARSSYLPLLEIRAEENPNDIYGLYYLMREYLFKDPGNLKGLNVAMDCYVRILSKKEDLVDDMEVLPYFVLAIGDVFNVWDMDDEAKYFYKKALELAPYLRQSYINYGIFAAYHGDYITALHLMDEMEEKIPDKYPTWYECDYNWTWRPYQVRAVAKCWEGKYKEAKTLFEHAINTYLTTEIDMAEANLHGFFNDYKWLTNYIENHNIDV